MNYSPEELREMAQHALAARDLGDPRWLMLVIQLAVTFDIDPGTVEQHIAGLAE